MFKELTYPKIKYLIEQNSLSRVTVKRRTYTISNHLEEASLENINKFSNFSLALDESTDINDTARLVVFICGATDDFETEKQFLDPACMKSTTKVLKMTEKFELDPI